VCEAGANLLRNTDDRIQHGIGKGLRFNVGRSHSGFILGTHEPTLQKAFAALLGPGMTMFDVGANVGYYATICARLVGPSGAVICFEPLPENAKQIAHNAALNSFRQMSVRGEALGADDGVATFLQSAEPTWGKLKSAGKLPDKYVGELQVHVRKLDSVMCEGILPAPNLIKIDVEGAEQAVLEGAGQTIASSRPVLMIELHGTNIQIAATLSDFHYEAMVLGRNTSVTDSPWDALVIAVPKEDTVRVKLIRNFCSNSAVGVR